MLLSGSMDPSESAREFLQIRVCRFSRLVTLLLLFVVTFRIWGVIRLDRMDRLFHPATYAMGGMLVLFGGLWLLSRRGKLPGSTLRTLESVVMVTSGGLVVWAAQIMPLAAHPELHCLVALALLLVGRALYVPSTARQTLFLGLAMGVPLMVMTFLTYSASDQAALQATYGQWLRGSKNLSLVFALWTGLYWVGFVVLCTMGARVIYGLRKEARDARRLGQYTLVRKLGEGGMGEVWLAKHALLRRPTAVKLLPSANVGERAIARFEREVQLTAELSHPNTITIYDFGHTSDGTFYYVMELVRGGTLEDVVGVDGPQPPERVVHILRQAAGALAEAHAVGLVHRDVKPANIMLCTQGGEHDVAKVVDFGLVKDLGDNVSTTLSTADTISGTPLYMSPEAISDPASLDYRADLYALGAVGYYLLTGSHVFEGKTVLEVCASHLKETPVLPSERLGRPVPADLEALVMQCLAKAPSERPASATELQTRLRGCEVPAWDPDWWWDEYGHLVGPDLVHTVSPRSSQVERSLAIDLAER